jgi:hypothetical protein
MKHFLGLSKRAALLLSVVLAVLVISSTCSQNTASKSVTSSQPTSDTGAAVPTVVPGAPHPADRERVPDLLLATPRGEFRLSEQTGKVTLLYFSFPG